MVFVEGWGYGIIINKNYSRGQRKTSTFVIPRTHNIRRDYKPKMINAWSVRLAKIKVFVHTISFILKYLVSIVPLLTL